MFFYGSKILELCNMLRRSTHRQSHPRSHTERTSFFFFPYERRFCVARCVAKGDLLACVAPIAHEKGTFLFLSFPFSSPYLICNHRSRWGLWQWRGWGFRQRGRWRWPGAIPPGRCRASPRTTCRWASWWGWGCCRTRPWFIRKDQRKEKEKKDKRKVSFSHIAIFGAGQNKIFFAIF